MFKAVDKKILMLEPIDSADNATGLLTKPLLKAPFLLPSFWAFEMIKDLELLCQSLVLGGVL